MITFTCDRCKKDFDKIYRVGISPVELLTNHSLAGYQQTTAEVCESCAKILDQMLAKECNKPVVKK